MSAQRAYMSGTVCLLSLFSYSCITVCFFLTCQRSVSVLSAPCRSTPLSGLSCSSSSGLHSLWTHITTPFFLPTMSTPCPLLPPCGYVWQQQQPKTVEVFIYGCPKGLAVPHCSLLLCLCVGCHALCYAKVVRMLMSHYKGLFLFVALNYEFFVRSLFIYGYVYICSA